MHGSAVERGTAGAVGNHCPGVGDVVNADFLNDLIALSARIGADPSLVQGGGGNTSLKRDDALWVKASGTWLAHAHERDIFVSLPLAQVRDALRHDDGEARVNLLSQGLALRPSIETSLHALLPHALVVHVHSVATIAWAVRRDAQTQLAQRLNGLNWAWVPYRRPGHRLTQAVAGILDTQAPDVLVLGNHGLVVGAADRAGAEALLAEVERRLRLPQRDAPSSQPQRLAQVNDLHWAPAPLELAHALATDAQALRVAAGGVLYPDHAVFLGPRAAVVNEGERLSAALARTAAECGAAPCFALVPGAGVLTAPDLSAGAQAMLHCLALVALRLDGEAALAELGEGDVAELIDWEAEKYRRSLMRTTN
ncbi:class II aldolase/adducin family protein [Lysobacter enzymogenes]|uniref:class II aldolase/adducin family protein n=1 Tax=Lysobacter enzymogenes TaxID=69 RepID=UPI003749BA8D